MERQKWTIKSAKVDRSVAFRDKSKRARPRNSSIFGGALPLPIPAILFIYRERRYHLLIHCSGIIREVNRKICASLPPTGEMDIVNRGISGATSFIRDAVRWKFIEIRIWILLWTTNYRGGSDFTITFGFHESCVETRGNSVLSTKVVCFKRRMLLAIDKF